MRESALRGGGEENPKPLSKIAKLHLVIVLHLIISSDGFYLHGVLFSS